MEDRIEKDDAIGRLMREEGLMRTSPGFTDRVMLLVEESRQKPDFAYKPLISRKTWIFLALTMTTLILVCFVGLGSDNPDQLTYLSKIRKATDFLTTIHASLHFDSGAMMLTTLTMLSVSLLLFMDFLLGKHFREMLK